MSRRESEEVKQLRERLLAEVERAPGLTAERLCVRVGVSSYVVEGGKQKPNRRVARALQKLETDGLIRMEQTILSEKPLIFPSDYQSPLPKRPLFQGRGEPPLRVYVGPSIAGTTPKEFVRSSIKDLPITPNPRKEVLEMPHSPAFSQKLKSFKVECDRMVADSVIRPLSKVCRDAGLHSNWGHTTSEAKTYYKNAVERLERMGVTEEAEEKLGTTEPISPPETPTLSPPSVTPVVQLEEELHRLKQELEQKNRRLSELEWEVEESEKELEKATLYANELEHELSQLKTQPRTTADPYEWILQQREIWRAEVEQLSADLAAAEKNFSVFQRLADLYETQPQESNERSERANDQISGGNGNREWSNGDQPPLVDAELHRQNSNGAAVARPGALG